MDKLEPNLLLASKTKQQIDDFIEHPYHGLLIIGAKGSGKTSILDYLATRLLNIEPNKLASYPYLLRLTIEGPTNSIGIDTVHQLDRFFGRVVSQPKNQQNQITRVVIIDDAEYLSLDAQNALLKNLEEPPQDSVFLLSSTNSTKLLPTLLSRVRTIRLANPTQDDITSYLMPLVNNHKVIKQAINMSGGVPGLAIAIALNQNDHSLIKASIAAKQILSSDTYAKLLLVNSLAKDPKFVTEVLFLIQQMARLGLETAEAKQSTHWQKVLNTAYLTEQQLAQNTNPKLTLTNMMLHL